ncbi:MAG: hypothetical protein KatS3mg042_0025 [Rhodothermaceae bacterium]|nr:MAG: hypothetical protein KatS3mg042_0025 [Rhodothermaceae bacterium]
MPSPQVLAQELNGETVLLHTGRGCYYGLDDVGTRMWRALLAHGTVQRACEALLQEYDVSPDVLRHDLGELVARLKEHDLIQLVE